MPKVASPDVIFPLGFDYSVSAFVYIDLNAVRSGIFLRFLARALKYVILKKPLRTSKFLSYA